MSLLRYAFDVVMPMPSAPPIVTLSFSGAGSNKRLTLHGHHDSWVLEEGGWGLRLQNDPDWRERAMTTEQLEVQLRGLQRTEPQLALRIREALEEIEDGIIENLVEKHPHFMLQHLYR